MGSKRLLAAFSVLLLASAASAGKDFERVGPLGHPDKLVIEGARAFSPGEIRAALFNELDVVAACEPDALLTRLTTVIADKTAAGYHEAGFCDVDVKVAAADGKLLMTIEEGERFVNGEIDVSGNRRIDAEKIKTDLTRPDAAGWKGYLRWQPEKDAAFSPETDARFRRKALQFVNDQGFYLARLKVNVEPDRSAKRTTPRVDIVDEGPLSTLGDVVIEGNERNGREALMAHLKLDDAAPLTPELREQIERRLLASGRFIEVRWDLLEPDKRDAEWRPRLVLKESTVAPTIDEPVSREEAALLKLAEWIGQIGDRNDELLHEDIDGNAFQLLAPQRGFITCWKLPGGVVANDGPAFDFAIVMDEERVGLYSAAQRRKLVAAPPPAPFAGEMVLNIINGPPKWSGQSNTKLSVSARTKKGDRRHIKTEVKLNAAAALSVLRHHKANCEWDGDVLNCTWGTYRLRVNALTGQLVEYVKQNPPDDDDDVPSGFRLVVEPGEFDRRLREIEKASADWPNVADVRRPLSCLGEFVCSEMEHCTALFAQTAHDVFEGDDAVAKELNEEFAATRAKRYDREQRGYAALRKAISLGILEPFDRLPSQLIPWQDGRFSIPERLVQVRARSLDELPAAFRELAPIFGVRVGKVLFPADSWMNRAWHQGLCLVANKDLLVTYSPSPPDKGLGALRSLATAELLRAEGHNLESKMWALGPLDAEFTFRDECRELVSGEGLVSQVLLRAAATMRQLDVAEIEALTGLLVEFGLLDQAQAAALEFAGLRAHVEDSPEQAATQALRALWRVGLADWIKRHLDELSGINRRR